MEDRICTENLQTESLYDIEYLYCITFNESTAAVFLLLVKHITIIGSINVHIVLSYKIPFKAAYNTNDCVFD